ncbi:MAG: ring-opening amidohydrolase [Mesorhizobium sp.]|nr:ring-opening amidohydrolase [Mesorhizobium sp.]
MSSFVDHFEMSSPDDVQKLGHILRRLSADKPTRVALIAKVEGTATTNDFSRSLALRAIGDAVDEAGLDPQNVHTILSTGCEGVISPGGFVFADFGATGRDEGGLRVGFSKSSPLSSTDLLSQNHIDSARLAVEGALRDCGLTGADRVLVFMKSPLMTHQESIDLPEERARFAGISGAARGAAALGMAVALGEIDPADALIDNLLRRTDLFSRRGMVFSGTETRSCEAIVIGQLAGSTSGLQLHCGVVDDLLDIEGMAAIMAPDANASIDAARARSGDVVAAFFKAGVRQDGLVRGRRTTVFSSDLDPDKHMRAAASGVVAALTGDCRMFVSGGCEHQSPDGGGVFAVVTRN